MPKRGDELATKRHCFQKLAELWRISAADLMLHTAAYHADCESFCALSAPVSDLVRCHNHDPG